MISSVKLGMAAKLEPCNAFIDYLIVFSEFKDTAQISQFYFLDYITRKRKLLYIFLNIKNVFTSIDKRWPKCWTKVVISNILDHNMYMEHFSKLGLLQWSWVTQKCSCIILFKLCTAINNKRRKAEHLYKCFQLRKWNT